MRPPFFLFRQAVFILFFGLGLVLGPAATVPAAAADPLTVYYFHRPPYYIQLADGGAGGFLVEATRKIFEEAGLPFRLEELPPKRILRKIKEGEPVGSIGWFRNPQRDMFARFTRPVYRNQPLCIITRGVLANQLPAEAGLAEILSRNLTLGVIDGFSYGTWADDQIRAADPPIYRLAGSEEGLLKMVRHARIDYTLMAPEEARYALRTDPELGERLAIVGIADAPPGNERHLMFSRSVAQSLVERLDRAILKLQTLPAYRRILESSP